MSDALSAMEEKDARGVEAMGRGQGVNEPRKALTTSQITAEARES
jgi:hypothetical protein